MTKEIKLPTYEDGTPVRFGDVIINRDGEKFTVTCISIYEEDSVSLSGTTYEGKPAFTILYDGENAERADSWEQLERDSEKYACDYFGMEDNPSCNGCPAFSKSISCKMTQVKDIMRRAKKLAGVEDE